jgi:hypothetical protein
LTDTRPKELSSTIIFARRLTFMPTVTGKRYHGPFILSLEDVEDDLVDLPDGALRGLRTEQEGMDGVSEELAKSIPAYGEEAGISPKVYARFVEGTDKITKLRKHEAELEKALEVVRETRAKKEHDRENEISMIVDAVKSTAQRTGDKALTAAFEKTLKYNAQIAEKAAQTRRKNAAEKPPAQEGGTGPKGDGGAG